MQRLIVGLTALVAVALVGVSWQVHGLSSQLERITFDPSDAMQSLHDTWRCNHVTKEVTTERNAGESDTDFCSRHNAVVRAQQATFPPDNT